MTLAKSTILRAASNIGYFAQYEKGNTQIDEEKKDHLWSPENPPIPRIEVVSIIFGKSSPNKPWVAIKMIIVLRKVIDYDYEEGDFQNKVVDVNCECHLRGMILIIMIIIMIIMIMRVILRKMISKIKL